MELSDSGQKSSTESMSDKVKVTSGVDAKSSCVPMAGQSCIIG